MWWYDGAMTVCGGTGDGRRATDDARYLNRLRAIPRPSPGPLAAIMTVPLCDSLVQMVKNWHLKRHGAQSEVFGGEPTASTTIV